MVKEANKTALVLAGGGITGWLYEIGCLAAMDDFFEDGFRVNNFDIIVGTSAGAAVAALMANLVSPEEIFEAILTNKRSPYNFRRKDIYSFNWREYWESLIKLIKVTPSIARYWYKNRLRPSVLDLIYTLEEHLPSGILSLNNLENSLSWALNQEGLTNDFRSLKKELYIPATDLDTGRYTVFGEGEDGDVPITLAVTASSALPIFFKPVTIKGRDYIDGGIGRVAHMDIALNHGANLILIINPTVHVVNDRKEVCIPAFKGHCARLMEKGVTFIADQALRINTSTRLYLAMKRYRAEVPNVDFLQIQPKYTEPIMFMYNILSLSGRVQILNYGYNSTARILQEEYDTFKEAFARRNIRVSLDRLSPKY